MKPWEHPEVKKALKKLKKLREEKIYIQTPTGQKKYILALYADANSVEYVELKSDTDYIILPLQVLKEILSDIEATKAQ